MTQSQHITQLRPYFADLHIHIGSSSRGEYVKISASKKLTFQAIAHEAAIRKGIALLGVIDCHSPVVQKDIQELLDSGEMQEEPGGGIRYRDTVILLGAEMEVREQDGGPYHLLGFLPDLASMMEWTGWLRQHTRNVQLSSQRVHVTAKELQAELIARGGLLMPAHVFTPHRGLLGCSASLLEERLALDHIAGVELGLSSDTAMASRISQLDRFAFLTNSDAHSTGMIGRECMELRLATPSFAELVLALRGEGGRGIITNHGLHPKLGKYHITWCTSCQQAVADKAALVCPVCGNSRLIRGVADRIDQLADRMIESEVKEQIQVRPTYLHQVPLSFFPGVGPASRAKLFEHVGTEMEILHKASAEQIAAAAGEKTAEMIIAAREQRVDFVAGSGGKYGKLIMR